jgi:hypothetical protein
MAQTIYLKWAREPGLVDKPVPVHQAVKMGVPMAYQPELDGEGSPHCSFPVERLCGTGKIESHVTSECGTLEFLTE